MEEKTPTQILKEINDLKLKHDKIKSDILIAMDELVEKENFLNALIAEMEKTESQYVELMEQLINK